MVTFIESSFFSIQDVHTVEKFREQLKENLLKHLLQILFNFLQYQIATVVKKTIYLKCAFFFLNQTLKWVPCRILKLHIKF